MSELVKEFEEFLGRKESEIDTLKARVQDLEASYRGAKHDAEHFEKRVAELEAGSNVKTCVLLTQQREAATNESKRLALIVDQLRSRLAVSEGCSERRATERDELQGKVNLLEYQRDQLRKQADYVQGNNSVLEAKINELNETIELQHRANHRMQVQLDNAHKAGFEAGELANKLAKDLKALKPKPVVEFRYMDLSHPDQEDSGLSKTKGDFDNLKLTFHDGVLISTEVINKGETK